MKRLIIACILLALPSVASAFDLGFSFSFGGGYQKPRPITYSYYLLTGGTNKYLIASGDKYQVASR